MFALNQGYTKVGDVFYYVNGINNVVRKAVPSQLDVCRTCWEVVDALISHDEIVGAAVCRQLSHRHKVRPI